MADDWSAGRVFTCLFTWFPSGSGDSSFVCPTVRTDETLLLPSDWQWSQWQRFCTAKLAWWDNLPNPSPSSTNDGREMNPSRSFAEREKNFHHFRNEIFCHSRWSWPVTLSGEWSQLPCFPWRPMWCNMTMLPWNSCLFSPACMAAAAAMTLQSHGWGTGTNQCRKIGKVLHGNLRQSSYGFVPPVSSRVSMGKYPCVPGCFATSGEMSDTWR